MANDNSEPVKDSKANEPIIRLKVEAPGDSTRTADITSYAVDPAHKNSMPADLPDLSELVIIHEKENKTAKLPYADSNQVDTEQQLDKSLERQLDEIEANLLELHDKEASAEAEIVKHISPDSISRLYVEPVKGRKRRFISERWVLTVVAASISGSVTYYGFLTETQSASWAISAAVLMVMIDAPVQYFSSRIGDWVTNVDPELAKRRGEDLKEKSKDKTLKERLERALHGAGITMGLRGKITLPIVSVLLAVKIASPAIAWQPTFAFAGEMYLQWSYSAAGALLASTPQIETLKLMKTKSSSKRMDRVYDYTFFALTMFARTAMVVSIAGAPKLSGAMLIGLFGATGTALGVVSYKANQQVKKDRLLAKQIAEGVKDPSKGPCGNIFKEL